MSYDNSSPPPSSSGKWIVITLLIVLLVIALVIIAIPILCCGGCAMVGMGGIQLVEQQIVEGVRNTQPVKDHLGENLDLSINFTATGDEQQRSGVEDALVFDAKGSKGEGQIIVVNSPDPGKPYESARLRLRDGREFVLPLP